MIITCENCSTSFKLDGSLLKSAGSKVRCSNCRNTFLVYPPSSPDTHDTREDTGNREHGPGGELEDHVAGDGSDLQLDGAVSADSKEQRADLAVDDEALPEKLLDMDEDAIAQMLKLDETPQDQPDTGSPDGETLDLPLDLDLNFEDDAASVTSGVEEIDLSELEQVLEEDQAMVAEDGLTAEEPELKLAIDEEPETAAETGETDLEEIDLSELEQVLEEDEAVVAEDGQAAEEPELKLAIDEEPETAAETGDAGLEEIDLSELEQVLEEDEAMVAEDGLTAEEPELKLAIDEEPETAAETGDADLEEIDLSELEQVLEEDEAMVAEDGLTAEEPELKLDIDEEPEMAVEGEEPGLEEIDLSELEQALEGLEEVSTEESDGGDNPDAADLEAADLELEMAPSGEAGLEEAAEELIDESELEQALGNVQETLVSENIEVDVPEAFELDLERGAAEDGGLETTAEILTDEEEGTGLEEIEKALNLEDESDMLEDLSLEMGEESAAASEGTDGQEEIDLSDIEQLLESDEGFAASVAEKPEFTDESDDSEERIDVSEIEEVLSSQPEQADEPVTDVAMEDLDLEFDIDEEPVAEETAQETFFAEDSSDFEFEEEDLEIAQEPAVHDESVEEALQETGSADAAEEMALEVEREDASEGDAGAGDVDIRDAASPVKPPVAVAAAGMAASAAAARAGRRGGGGRMLPVFLVILLLLIGGYVAYSLYPGKTIAGLPRLGDLNIPYVSQFFQSGQQSDAGNLRIKTSDVTSRFVDSTKAGRLFVISGKLKNEYPQQRSAIKIIGKLYRKGKKLVQSQTVTGGIFISDLELSRMNAAQIKKRLSQPGRLLKSGQSQPFMIVFSNLPEDLEEFTIEVLSSKK